MAVKAILILCAHVLLIQSARSQCASSINYGGCGLNAPTLAAPIALPCEAGFGYGTGLGYEAGLGYGAGLGYSGFAIEAIPTSGGGLPIFSASAIAPSGLSVSSENVFEGALSVAGELPFVSAVALEGVLPSAGAGAVSYSCGNGVTAIESITPAAAIASGAGAYGAGIGAYNYGVSGYGSRFGGIGPLSIGAGCNVPAMEVISPIVGCGCGGLY